MAFEVHSWETDLLWDFGISYVSGMTISELQEQLDRRDKQIEELATRIRQLERENQELKKLLVEKAQSKECKPPKEARNFSVSRYEQKRRTRRRRKNSTGRRPKDAKRGFATETIDLYWHDARRKTCVLRREQFVWRLIDGKSFKTHGEVHARKRLGGNQSLD